MTLRSFYEHVFDTEVKLTGQRYTQAWDSIENHKLTPDCLSTEIRIRGTRVWPTKGELIYIIIYIYTVYIIYDIFICLYIYNLYIYTYIININI